MVLRLEAWAAAHRPLSGILAVVASSSEEYWQATEYVVELARDLVIDENVPTDHVERLLEFEPAFLGRVLANIAAAQMLLISEAASLDLSKEEVLNVLLVPLYPLEVVSTVPAHWEAFATRVWHVIQRREKTTDDLEIHPSFEYTASPRAMTLNCAMPVIVNLLHKGVALQPRIRPEDRGKPVASRPVDQRDHRSWTSDAVTQLVAYLRSWLTPHEEGGT